ncbi:MAG: hypothetical protein V5A45_07190 [Haloarculaceae archaeon]
MVDYTTPVTTTFELQRQTIEQSQQALHRTVELQQRVNNAVVDSMESSESAQRRLVELQQNALHNTLDAVEANVPGVGEQLTELRDAVDEQYEMLLENHAEAFDTLSEELDEGIATYDDVSGDYLGALEEQVDLLLETHEELETQSVEAVEQLATQVEELQAQVEEMQSQMQEVSEQAVEAVEA